MAVASSGIAGTAASGALLVLRAVEEPGFRSHRTCFRRVHFAHDNAGTRCMPREFEQQFTDSVNVAALRSETRPAIARAQYLPHCASLRAGGRSWVVQVSGPDLSPFLRNQRVRLVQRLRRPKCRLSVRNRRSEVRHSAGIAWH